MEAVTLARPYARAAFDLARANGAMDDWSSNLALAAGIAADPQMAGLGNDPRVAPDALVRLHCPDGVAEGSVFARFLKVLAENRRLVLLPEVAECFDGLRRAAERVAKVRLVCAAQPADGQVEALTGALRSRLDSAVELTVDVDPDILGGAIIDLGGEVIDGSVRARLEQLRSALTH